jgi:hypothetical protein
VQSIKFILKQILRRNFISKARIIKIVRYKFERLSYHRRKANCSIYSTITYVAAVATPQLLFLRDIST